MLDGKSVTGVAKIHASLQYKMGWCRGGKVRNAGGEHKTRDHTSWGKYLASHLLESAHFIAQSE